MLSVDLMLLQAYLVITNALSSILNALMLYQAY